MTFAYRRIANAMPIGIFTRQELNRPQESPAARLPGQAPLGPPPQHAARRGRCVVRSKAGSARRVPIPAMSGGVSWSGPAQRITTDADLPINNTCKHRGPASEGGQKTDKKKPKILQSWAKSTKGGGWRRQPWHEKGKETQAAAFYCRSCRNLRVAHSFCYCADGFKRVPHDVLRISERPFRHPLLK